MTEPNSTEFNSDKDSNENSAGVLDTLKSTGEVRDYIEEMKASSNIDALKALLKEAESRYRGMRGSVGGEYEFQYYEYVIGEIKAALKL